MAVLIVAGTHVPVIPFVEVAGRRGGVLFWHSGPKAAKAVGIRVFVVITRVVVVAH